MAEGMAINSVVKVKTEPKSGSMPVTYMWCPQTMKERKAMANIEPIMAR